MIRMRWSNPLLSLLCSLIAATVAQTAEPRDVVFRSAVDDTEQRYVELLPDRFDHEKPCDVVVALHGHGADRWQFIREPRGECRATRDVASENGAIVISPDYRARTSWMGPHAEADVLQILKEVQQRYAVRRVYVVGGSMGGTSALIFTARHPERVAGVCSLNGTANMLEFAGFPEAITAAYGGTKSERPDEYRNRSAELWPERFTMPVAITTGGKDTVVPPDSSLRLLQQLQRDGRPVLGIHRADGGHSTTYEDSRRAIEFLFHASESRSGETGGKRLPDLPSSEKR